MTQKSPTDYLRMAPVGAEEGDRHIGRVIDLAELPFNLRNVPGIEKRVDTLRTDMDKIEDTVAELAAVKLLVVSGRPVRFVDPIGVKGSGYDVELPPPGGEKVFCDVKCKVESTEQGSETIYQSLKARKQLPADGIGLVNPSIGLRICH